ncbi:hypothetical protein GCM10011490_10910 [Pseudoclavibacter endophyticus]|uniref:Nuclear transport factor 2 family protein n=1 Tax=Pseudoclavibacter endophyticus TaxID=1778590 RepID=A0A6H9WT45_9MICO|nr:hypothetical protein [Pseudoclavibacter endophyticus]KAB1649480.1 hypothetical protein F8O04_04240 [Pseudoclavibacter endophyticus]GGA62299.1 hypothetical protein GCM10011490_10910 [Pseudoclavibacter endophyticus]
MTVTLSSAAPPALQEYYRILAAGPQEYGNGAVLRPLLREHLDFTGSRAGHHANATDGFIEGITGFIATVEQITIVRDVHDAAGSAVLYEAKMPGGVMSFAEFYTFVDGRIDTLHLHYDEGLYRELGGR